VWVAGLETEVMQPAAIRERHLRFLRHQRRKRLPQPVDLPMQLSSLIGDLPFSCSRQLGFVAGVDPIVQPLPNLGQFPLMVRQPVQRVDQRPHVPELGLCRRRAIGIQPLQLYLQAWVWVRPADAEPTHPKARTRGKRACGAIGFGTVAPTSGTVEYPSRYASPQPWAIRDVTRRLDSPLRNQTGGSVSRTATPFSRLAARESQHGTIYMPRPKQTAASRPTKGRGRDDCRRLILLVPAVRIVPIPTCFPRLTGESTARRARACADPARRPLGYHH